MTEKEWSIIFSKNLLCLLNESRLSQKDLSYLTGISEASISGYINGRVRPGVKAIINISNVFGISIEELIYYGEMID